MVNMTSASGRLSASSDHAQVRWLSRLSRTPILTRQRCIADSAPGIPRTTASSNLGARRRLCDTTQPIRRSMDVSLRTTTE